MANSNASTSEQAENTSGDDVDTAEMTVEQRQEKADSIVKDHILLGAAAGVMPSPGFDLVAGFGVQMAMLARLSKLYDVPYSKNVAKGVVMSLLASLGGLGAAGVIGISAIKLIPFVGSAVGMISMPITMGALTYALGKVFSEHFASGGTFLDFNPKSWTSYFKSVFERGKDVAVAAAAKVTSTTDKVAA